MSDEEFWGDVEIEPEVATWLASLDDGRFGQVRFAIDRLAEEGPLLGEPHTRQLREKVRELRFGLDGERWRITDFIASGRRIILLTVFRKQHAREPREIARAVRAFRLCLSEGHIVEE